jgi:ribosome-binding factor A
MSISDDSEDEEEIKKRLFADLDQISVADAQTEKSFVMEPINYVNDLAQSKTWLEFINQNRQRDQMLNEIEDNI